MHFRRLMQHTTQYNLLQYNSVLWFSFFIQLQNFDFQIDMTFLTYVSLQLLDLYLNTRVILVSSKYNNLFRFGFVFALYPPGILFVYMYAISRHLPITVILRSVSTPWERRVTYLEIVRCTTLTSSGCLLPSNIQFNKPARNWRNSTSHLHI